MLVEGARGDNEGTAGVAPRQGVFPGSRKTSVTTSGESVSRSQTEEIVPSAGVGDNASPGVGDGDVLSEAPGNGSGLSPGRVCSASAQVRVTMENSHTRLFRPPIAAPDYVALIGRCLSTPLLCRLILDCAPSTL